MGSSFVEIYATNVFSIKKNAANNGVDAEINNLFGKLGIDYQACRSDCFNPFLAPLNPNSSASIYLKKVKTGSNYQSYDYLEKEVLHICITIPCYGLSS